MSPLHGTKLSEGIVESLKELFEALNTAAPKQQHCLDCGSLLALWIRFSGSRARITCGACWCPAFQFVIPKSLRA
jgi:hypothetical protein